MEPRASLGVGLSNPHPRNGTRDFTRTTLAWELHWPSPPFTMCPDRELENNHGTTFLGCCITAPCGITLLSMHRATTHRKQCHKQRWQANLGVSDFETSNSVQKMGWVWGQGFEHPSLSPAANLREPLLGEKVFLILPINAYSFFSGSGKVCYKCIIP